MKNNYKLINIPEADMAFIKNNDNTIAHIMYDGHDRIYWYDKPNGIEYDTLAKWFNIESDGFDLTDYAEASMDR